jgi:pimeloyl-ACP methyl ester carboxylesterase
LSTVEESVLPDGRRAQLWTGGAASGPIVLICHGTPDTRWIARAGARAALTAGVRLVCVNRPGYGTSTPAPSTLASVADDVLAVLDQLGVDRVAVLGMSVGGAYAAALAARNPDLVAALALVATPRETSTALGPPAAEMARFRPEFERWAAGVAATDPDDETLAARWLGGLPTADAALLGAALSTREVAASVREALACHDGYLRDAALLFSDWGFDPAEVRCPTYLWYGARDDRNPPATGRWWADRIAGSELTVTPTTHLATLLANWPAILDALVGEGARSPDEPSHPHQ